MLLDDLTKDMILYLQMFFPVSNKTMAIKKGDILAARCTMDNYKNHVVRVGNTGNDEMCNFYIMYYVDPGSEVSQRKMCFSFGPPNYYWSIDPVFKSRIPQTVNIQASSLE